MSQDRYPCNLGLIPSNYSILTPHHGREREGGEREWGGEGEGEGIMPTVIVHASKSTVCCNALDVFFYAHAEPVLRVVVCEGLSITRSIIHTCQLI